jgi:excinuclease ABC subunit B
MTFHLQSPYPAAGDQPQAIAELLEGLRAGERHQTLLGVTGSGKTFTIANVLAQWGRPALVISHNKTLGAQLYAEFRQYFPEDALGFFISYYDYFQPEAYVPSTNTYIAKDASINDDIDRLRLQATSMLLERENVVIVASVSCLYGLGTPEDWRGMRIDMRSGAPLRRRELLDQLVAIQYQRTDLDLSRGQFRVRGDVVEVKPAYEDFHIRIELEDDVVTRLSTVDPVTARHCARRTASRSTRPSTS